MIQKMYNESKMNLYVDKVLGENMMLFALLISFEYKSGRLKSNDVGNTDWIYKITQQGVSETLRRYVFNDANKSKGDMQSTVDYETEFVQRYKLVSVNLFPIKAVYQYLLSGFLDITEFDNEMELALRWKNDMEAKTEQPQYKLFKELEGFYWQDDEAVINRQKEQVLNYVRASAFRFYDYGLIYRVLKQLYEAGLMDEVELQDAEKQLIDGCLKAIKRNAEPFVNLAFIHRGMHSGHFRAAGHHKELDRIVSEYLDKLAEINKEGAVNTFFDAMATKDNYYYDGEYMDHNPFKDVSGRQFFERIKGLNTPQLRNLRAFFFQNTRIGNIKEFYTNEHAEQLMILITLLQPLLEHTNDRLKRFHLRELLNAATVFHSVIE